MCGEKEREIDFKELAHGIVGACEEAAGQAGNPVAGVIAKESSSGNLSLL